jgi:uncharacterized membrane-anchored protein YitT (DUF2179 family)
MSNPRISLIRDYVLIIVGVVLQAVAFLLFLIPAELAAGGVSGAAQIINSFTGWPIGMMVLIANIPLFFLGWRFLGGHRFFIRTIIASVLFSVVLDSLTFAFPAFAKGVTDDLWLNALYGAILGGIGGALVLRAQATSGGTEILARLISRRYGISLTQSYMYTDALVVFLSGLAFSWTQALYALLVVYVWGVVTDFVLEGQSVVRAATIITDKPDEVGKKVLDELARGVTAWPGKGMYSGEGKQVLYCVVSRAEVAQLKTLIHEADPGAFVVIGQAHEAFGEGFKQLGAERH